MINDIPKVLGGEQLLRCHSGTRHSAFRTPHSALK
jgi:hypothetical protein